MGMPLWAGVAGLIGDMRMLPSPQRTTNEIPVCSHLRTFIFSLPRFTRPGGPQEGQARAIARGKDVLVQLTGVGA